MPEPIQTPEDGTEVVEQPTQTPAEPSQPTPPVVDYEKKFKESQQENQLLREAERQRQEAEQESTKEPTDSEYRKAFPSWDSYDETQKELARETFAARHTATIAERTARGLREEKEWSTSIELATSSHPALQGKEQAFRQYASQPKYRGIPMDVLISAFLGSAAPVTTETPKTPPKPGLESGTGGPKTPEKPKVLSGEELKTLRQTDERAYQEYIKTHDLSDIV